MLYTVIYYKTNHLDKTQLIHIAEENYGIVIAHNEVKNIQYIIFGFKQESHRERFLSITKGREVRTI